MRAHREGKRSFRPTLKWSLTAGCLLMWAPSSLTAGAWTLPQGHLWAKATYFQQKTDEWYIASPQFVGKLHKAGTRRPYLFNGEYDSQAVFLEAYYGVTDRLDLGVQVPFFDQVFDDDTRLEPPSDSGFSDIRFFAKLNALQKPVLVTFKGGVKIPTGDFVNEDGLIPVGEGQWDFDFIVQVARSFWPLPVYANVDLGYRIRLENDETLRDPGEEFLFNGEVGLNLTRRLLLATKLELLRGTAGTDFGFKNTSQIKRITYLSPTIMYNLHGGTTAELAYRFSLNGRNFPAGKQLTLGLSQNVDFEKVFRRSR